MRALVTGGAGFIGSALAKALLDRGDSVGVFDNLLTGTRSAIPEGAELFEGDLRDVTALEEACESVDVVFHQAALRSVPRSVEEPELVHACNATGTLNVLLASERRGVERVVYASSSSVYGGAESGRSREDQTPRPLSPYAVSKLTGEYYCSVWSQLARMSTVSLRYFNVFGPGQKADSRYSAVFPAFISSIKAGESPVIHWDGEQSRDFTFIDDVVRANMAAAEADEEASGSVINIAGGKPRSVNEMFEAVSRAMQSDLLPRYEPKREGDIRHSFADLERAERLLSWQPIAGWEESVDATVAWFVKESRSA